MKIARRPRVRRDPGAAAWRRLRASLDGPGSAFVSWRPEGRLVATWNMLAAPRVEIEGEHLQRLRDTVRQAEELGLRAVIGLDS